MGGTQVVLQVDSRAEDLLEAGKVAFEAIGEKDAAAGMHGGVSGSEGIQFEVRGDASCCAASCSQPLAGGALTHSQS